MMQFSSFIMVSCKCGIDQAVQIPNDDKNKNS